jgi:hypothetical protein
MVDLYRISGVGSEFAELLEASGDDAVAELWRRPPCRLAEKMADVSKAKKLTLHAPTEAERTSG